MLPAEAPPNQPPRCLPLFVQLGSERAIERGAGDGSLRQGAALLASAPARRPQRASGEDGPDARSSRNVVRERGRELCAGGMRADPAALPPAVVSHPDGRLTSELVKSDRSACTARGLLAGTLARKRRRARSCAQVTPNATSSAGPRDASVSSMGMPPMCAKGALIIGRSRLCSRRLGGAPRGRARDRRVGHGSRRRSRGRPPSRPPVSS
jgi:hypothetical protein